MRKKFNVMITVLLIIAQLFSSAFTFAMPQEAEIPAETESAEEIAVVETTEEQIPAIRSITLECAETVLIGGEPACSVVVDADEGADAAYTLNYNTNELGETTVSAVSVADASVFAVQVVNVIEPEPIEIQEEVPADETPVEAVLTEDIPTEEALTEEVPVEEILTEAAPAEETSAEVAPTEEIAVEAVVPTEEVPETEAVLEEATEELASAMVYPGKVPADKAVAYIGKSSNLIIWQTDLDTDVNHYVVQRRTIGRDGTTVKSDWSQIYSVKQLTGDKAKEEFSYVDSSRENDLSLTFEYRINACGTTSNIKDCTVGDSFKAVFSDDVDASDATPETSDNRSLEIRVDLEVSSFPANVAYLVLYRQLNSNGALGPLVQIAEYNAPGSYTYYDKNVAGNEEYDYYTAYCVADKGGTICGKLSAEGHGVALPVSNLAAPTMKFVASYNYIKVIGASKDAEEIHFEICLDAQCNNQLADIYAAKDDDEPYTVKFENLDENTKYYFRAAAVDEDGLQSQKSKIANKATLAIPAPSGLKAAKGSASALLTWKEPKINDTDSYYDPINYVAEIQTGKNGAWTLLEDQILTQGDTGALIENLENNIQYGFRLHTCLEYSDADSNDGRVCGKAFSSAVTVIPEFVAPVIKSSASGPGSATITMKYYDTTKKGADDFDHYQLEYKLASESEWKIFARTTSFTTNAEGVQLTISPLTQGAAYNFRVAVVNPDGDISKYATAKLTIAATKVPSSIKAVPASTSVTLSWKDVPGVSDYELSWKKTTDPESAWSTANVSKTSYVVKDLTADSTYIFRVRSANQVCESLSASDCGNKKTIYSAYVAVNATPKVNAPKKLQGTVLGYSSVNLSWTGAQDIEYTVYMNPDSHGQNRFEDVLTTGVGELKATIEGLKNGTAYQFYVEAIKGSKKVSNTITLKTKTIEPPAVVTVMPHNKTAYMTWAAASDAGVTKYRALIATNPALLANINANDLASCEFDADAVAAGTAYGCQDIDASKDGIYKIGELENGKTYAIRIYSYLETEDTYSDSFKSVGVKPAFAPMQGVATSPTNHSVVLTWKPNADLISVNDENTGTYRIYFSDSSVFSEDDHKDVTATDAKCDALACHYEFFVSDTCGSGSAPYLGEGSKFYFHVIALDDNGTDGGKYTAALGTGEESQASSTINAQLTKLVSPSGLKALAADKSASVSWKVINGITKYEVYKKDNGVPNEEYVLVDTVDASSATAWDGEGRVALSVPGLTNGHTYSFVVYAVDDCGSKSVASAPITCTPTMKRVSGLKNTAPRFHMIQLTWDNLGYDDYYVEMSLSNRKGTAGYFDDGSLKWSSKDDDSGYINVFNIYDGKVGIPSGAITMTMAEAKTYYFRVTPGDGTTYDPEVYGVIKTVTVPMMPAPASLKVSKYSGISAQLKWAPVKGVNFYSIYRKGPGETIFTRIDTVEVDGTMDAPTSQQLYVDTTISQTGSYLYYVKSVVDYTDDGDGSAGIESVKTSPSSSVYINVGSN